MINKLAPPVRPCHWQVDVANVVMNHGGTADDAHFLASLARNVAPQKLPRNRKRAALELWRRQCAASRRT